MISRQRDEAMVKASSLLYYFIWKMRSLLLNSLNGHDEGRSDRSGIEVGDQRRGTGVRDVIGIRTAVKARRG